MGTISSPLRLQLPAAHRYLNVLGACINALIEHAELADNAEVVSYNIQLAANEIFANIVDHAYAERDDGVVDATLALLEAPPRMLIELHDTGAAFDQAQVAEPDLDDIQIRGYGLFLARSLLDEVEYLVRDGGNYWRLVKYL